MHTCCMKQACHMHAQTWKCKVSYFTWDMKHSRSPHCSWTKYCAWRCYERKVLLKKKKKNPKLIISALAWNGRRYSGEEGRIQIYVLFSVLHRMSTKQTANTIVVLGSALWIYVTGQVSGFSFAFPFHKVARKGKYSQPACCDRLPSPGGKRGSRPSHFFHFCPEAKLAMCQVARS